MRRIPVALTAIMLALGVFAATYHPPSEASGGSDYVNFEGGHVHPIAITPSGDRLLVVNTPDNRLSVFDITGSSPVRIAEIPVGLEPVSVACRSDGEAWVVNHLSDDVSIVNLTTKHVRATLRVGDEPGDVVFAGASAYVSVSQEDAVKVYDPASLALTGTIATSCRMPRALARNADGTRVYVAGFNSGNRTSVLSEPEVADSLPAPSPAMDPLLPPRPSVALIIRQLPNGNWVDESNKLWSSKAQYSVLDADISQINTGSNTITGTFGDIGSVNFGLAVSSTGLVVATATESRNFTRFEPNLRGHLVDTRAAFITTGGAVTLSNLNPAVNYTVTPGPASERDSAIGIPTGVAWSSNGQRAYVTALANDALAVLDPTQPNQVRARVRTVAGPTGIVVDDPHGRIWVVGRFRNQLQAISTTTLASLSVVDIGFDPTPDVLVNGRKFMYGGFTSGHGEQACASCHLFGDFDNLAWDLGDPTAPMQPVNLAGQQDPLVASSVHPMKGPMTTQTLRGLAGTGMLHWRADRTTLAAFNPAFIGLMGRAAQLPDSEMTAFDTFTRSLVHPPNPNQYLDRNFRDAPLHQPSARRGRDFFLNRPTDSDPPITCNQCHTASGFGPGTNGQISNRFSLISSQDMKAPQLRNLYRKTGFVDTPGAQSKRGFGFTHNGAAANVFDFLHFPGFDFNEPSTQTKDENRRDVEQFVLAFDTGMAPSIGAQVTFSGTISAPAVARMDTLEASFAEGDCELIAKGRVAGTPRGWLYLGSGLWKPDRSSEANLTSAALRALGGSGTEVTVTGVPVGSGTRMGIDRDRDTYFDDDELIAGSDPGNPLSIPPNVAVPSSPGGQLGLRSVGPNPFRAQLDIAFVLGAAGKVDCTVHDVMGREVKTLARGQRFEAGAQHLIWDGRGPDGRDLSAGVYFMRLQTPEGRWTRTVVRLHSR